MISKRYLLIFCAILFLFSCEDEVTITFQESSITTENNKLVEINIPIAEGNSKIAATINDEIRKVLMDALAIGDEEKTTSKSVEESVNVFNSEYTDFISDFPNVSQPWEAQIDGEVMYQSPNVISIAITSYVNTGGAHGHLNITFKNFNTLTGQISNVDLFKDINGFKKIAQSYFKKTTKEKDIFFEPEAFELPANMAYNDDGIILLYNTYEIAPYSEGIIEFTIPYHKVNAFLVIEGS